MKRRIASRATVFMVLLSLSVTLGGRLFACSDPSAMEMGKGRAMACCQERCRMETTHEAAKKACESSRPAFSTRDSIFSPKFDCAQAPVWIFSALDIRSLFYPPLAEPDDKTLRFSSGPPLFRPFDAVGIYTAKQAFLI